MLHILHHIIEKPGRPDNEFYVTETDEYTVVSE